MQIKCQYVTFENKRTSMCLAEMTVEENLEMGSLKGEARKDREK